LLGEFKQARERLDQLSSLYDPALHRDQAWLYGESGIAGHAWQALTLFMMGYSDQALRQTEESLRLGREVSHAVSQAYALILAAQHHQVRRESPQARELARAGQSLSTEHGLAYFSAWGNVLLAWTLAEQEPSADNIITLRSSIDALWNLGTESLFTYALILLAEVCSRAEMRAEGLASIDEALRLMEKNDDRNTEAELYRVRGELLLQGGASAAEAEACFRRAIEIAKRQEAKSWELRAAMRLARLWQKQGKREEARQMLAEIYGWFTEGFDTADLQEAKALLDELQS
jgi:adenylate cyclase